jgi:hypothetical protein
MADVSVRRRSAGLIRMGTLRGKRGLVSRCYGTVENVSKRKQRGGANRFTMECQMACAIMMVKVKAIL